MSVNVLLISDAMIKERTSIHGNIDPKLIYPDLKYAQDAFVKPILGTALFEKLQAIINDGSILTDPLVDYKYLIDTYIVDTLMYYVMAEMPESLSYQFWNKGVVRKQGQDTVLPDMSELVTIGLRYKNRAEYYANRLKLFLIDQSSRLGKYVEYRQPGSQVDTVTPEQRNFSMPVYLGDTWERDNPWCNPGGFNGEPYKP